MWQAGPGDKGQRKVRTYWGIKTLKLVPLVNPGRDIRANSDDARTPTSIGTSDGSEWPSAPPDKRARRSA